MNMHPVVVHFPLALVVTGTLCLTLSELRPLRPVAGALAVVGTWNLCMGAVALFVALGTGLAAAFDLNVSAAAHAAITAHVKSAILTTLLVLGAALWRGFGVAPASRPSGLFTLLLWLATASLIVTGYRGGQNVYVYAIGVHAADALAVKLPVATSGATPQGAPR
jgi:uncharacterized membrane protein